MPIINSGAHRFLSLWPSVQTYTDWILFQASLLVVKRCLKPVRASWHKPLEAGVRGHMADAIPAPVAWAGARGGGAHWWLWWYRLLGPAPIPGTAAGAYAKKSQPGRSQILQRAFEPWWDVLLFPLFQDVSIAPPKLTDLPLRIQLSFWSCTCLGGNVSAHFFPTQNTCYLPLRELFSLFKSKARLLESTSLNRTSLCHL